MTVWPLTAAAQADLQQILRHTRNEWGASQARYYAGELKQAIKALASYPYRHRTMPKLHAKVRIACCRQHPIFALPNLNDPTLILAILHERMNLIARLANRLP